MAIYDFVYGVYTVIYDFVYVSYLVIYDSVNVVYLLIYNATHLAGGRRRQLGRGGGPAFGV